MIGSELERKGRAAVAAQLDPITVVALEAPTGDPRIELGDATRVGAVEGEQGELGNRWHAADRDPSGHVAYPANSRSVAGGQLDQLGDGVEVACRALHAQALLEVVEVIFDRPEPFG